MEIKEELCPKIKKYGSKWGENGKKNRMGQ
jgi:hypothetical protein